MIILFIVFVFVVMLASCLFGCAVGFGHGYESRLLETMSEDEKNEYRANKAVMESIADKQRRYDI